MHTRVNECTPVTILRPMTDEPHYLDRRAAAEVLGVSPATLDRWVRNGRLTPFRTPSGHPRYTRAQLDRLLDPRPPQASHPAQL